MKDSVLTDFNTLQVSKNGIKPDHVLYENCNELQKQRGNKIQK